MMTRPSRCRCKQTLEELRKWLTFTRVCLECGGELHDPCPEERKVCWQEARSVIYRISSEIAEEISRAKKQM
jgi:hypothetical protein